METLHVHLDRESYQAVVGRGCLSDCGKLIAQVCRGLQVVVVTATPIHRQYGRVVVKSLEQAGLKPRVITVPDGEQVKSLRWASFLYDRFLQAKCERGSTVVALGGGVIGDLAGFVASTYLRGVNLIQVPTTLVAQVDASIGGKTGVNHPRGKNLIGTFSQPSLVISDVSVLRTLPQRDLVGGLAEVVKYGVIADVELFAYLEKYTQELLAYGLEALEHIVVRSARIKTNVVSKDEREAGLRQILNYGHTLGHAIEAATGYRRFHHGEAIAIGMQFAAFLAVRLRLCDPALADRQGRLLECLGLPIALPGRLDRRRLMAAMAHDKKVKGGQLHFVLPERIGSVRVAPVDDQVVKGTLADFAHHPASYT